MQEPGHANRSGLELPGQKRTRDSLAGLAIGESITRDLEAMKANGIGGALVCDNGLQELVTAECKVTGPGQVEMKLPLPPAIPIFYQDIAVQAIRKAPRKTGEEAIKNWSVKTCGKNDFNLDRLSAPTGAIERSVE